MASVFTHLLISNNTTTIDRLPQLSRVELGTDFERKYLFMDEGLCKSNVSEFRVFLTCFYLPRLIDLRLCLESLEESRPLKWPMRHAPTLAHLKSLYLRRSGVEPRSLTRILHVMPYV